jgi:2-oxoglutarate dehydrogenase E1 component
VNDPRNPSHADGYNAGYAEQLYETALREQGVVPPSLADFVEGVAVPPFPAVLPDAMSAIPVESVDRLRIAAAAGALVESYRSQGHLACDLDPLGSEPPGHPSLDPAFHGITESDLASIPSSAVGLENLGETALDAINQLRHTYCGHIGYELDHMEDPDQWNWLVDHIESGRHRVPLDQVQAINLLKRLTRVVGLERFLQRSYLGQKRFSLEGLAMMIPMLDEAILRGVEAGVRRFIIGMAHRGRLNVLAHIIGLPYENILAEFEGERSKGMQARVPETGSGDVKYHVGAGKLVRTEHGAVSISLAPNPSHLEHVNPVVAGMARATREQFAREAGVSTTGDEASADAGGISVLPILIHGDSAMIGQGVVAETMNLARLPGYETGGTLHLVANNQLGFTTLPGDTRSTRYASDLALAFRIPIVHVNADDPEACLAAARLAIDYRDRFGEDIVVDQVGYRLHGHNEADEPAYTQPVMYRVIRDHVSVREQWAAELERRGWVTPAEVEAMADRVRDRLARARQSVKSDDAGGDQDPVAGVEEGSDQTSEDGGALTEELAGEFVETGIPMDRLRELNDIVHTWPEGFTLYAKLGRQLERRRDSFDTAIDWAHAETLAFAGLVTEGTRIRLSGEDSERGTFSQRHLVLHDAENGETYTPLKYISPDQARFQVWNSPLSEVAVLGFEYGYSTVATETLVLWEAQFGDFANVAQAIIDQFIVAGRSKWGQESRLVLLLPHGYEGQGPEHSSARLERFLDLAAQENIRVANCTTPAQYFHLLRLQALRPARRPLVVLTPKSLLRHPAARSPATELATGRFWPVIEDPRALASPDEVRSAILCSGKVFFEVEASAAREASSAHAVIRVEELYPFPEPELARALARFPSLEEIVWLQEEPKNMGAWRAIASDVWRLSGEGKIAMRYAGRPVRASPAEGYASAHAREQKRLIAEALGS